MSNMDPIYRINTAVDDDSGLTINEHLRDKLIKMKLGKPKVRCNVCQSSGVVYSACDICKRYSNLVTENLSESNTR